MGEVIAFRAAGAPRQSAPPGEAAQILLFTGIRYLRIEAVEPTQDPAHAASRAPSRRRRTKRPA